VAGAPAVSRNPYDNIAGGTTMIILFAEAVEEDKELVEEEIGFIGVMTYTLYVLK
jgi:hypothetical protein